MAQGAASARDVELRVVADGGTAAPGALARAFIPCPVCGGVIELPRGDGLPSVLECPSCEARLVERRAG